MTVVRTSRPSSSSGQTFSPVAAGALYWEAEDTLHRRRSAPGKGRGLRRAGHDAAALRHARHARAPRRVHRGLRAAAAWWRSATASTAASWPDASLRATWSTCCDCSAAAIGTGSSAITIRDLPDSDRRLRLPLAQDRRHHPLPPAVLGRQRREIAGHLHPVARIARRGEVIRRRCFATDGKRLVMPAFGAYAGGLNVLDEAFAPLFLWHRLEAWMTGEPASIRCRRACCCRIELDPEVRFPSSYSRRTRPGEQPARTAISTASRP